MVPPWRNLQLLVALLRYSERAGYTFHSVSTVCKFADLVFPDGLEDLLVEQLVDSGHVQTSERVLDEPLANRVFETTMRLTGKGLASAEIWTDSVERGNSVPASDRYVSLTDNQRVEATLALIMLKQEARGANDVEGDDRAIVLAEIAAFETTIVQQRVATDLIQRFVDRVRKWMMTMFTGAVFAEAAQRLIQALLKLIT